MLNKERLLELGAIVYFQRQTSHTKFTRGVLLLKFSLGLSHAPARLEHSVLHVLRQRNRTQHHGVFERIVDEEAVVVERVLADGVQQQAGSAGQGLLHAEVQRRLLIAVGQDVELDPVLAGYLQKLLKLSHIAVQQPVQSCVTIGKNNIYDFLQNLDVYLGYTELFLFDLLDDAPVEV
jgi:hypothetical protein